MDPKEIQDFMKLPQNQKCLFMFTTLTNHISALKEIKWWIRGIGATIAAYAVNLVLGG